MGLLADIYSYGDGAKRRLRGLLEDPSGTLGLGVARFDEDQRQVPKYPMGLRAAHVGDV